MPRKVRRAQTIVPFGVGAIYDFSGESLAAVDIYHWGGKGDAIRLERLEKALGVKKFLMAKQASGDHPSSIPYVRFPAWLFCKTCRRMVHMRQQDETGNPPRCPTCRPGRELVPMRFIAVCEKGHMCDVPWGGWAHSSATNQRQRQCGNHRLEFRSLRERGGGLVSLEVRCSVCDAKRTLQGITSKGAMNRIGFSCPGVQPWQRLEEGGACGEEPRIVQRGASNVYYPVVRSALDISSFEARQETVDDVNRITNHAFFDTARQLARSQTGITGDPGLKRLVEMISEQVGVSTETVFRVLKEEVGGAVGVRDPRAIEDLMVPEWKALVSPPREVNPRDPFIAGKADLKGFCRTLKEKGDAPLKALLGLLEDVVLVTRLREVRVLAGFQRFKPESRPGYEIAADLGRNLGWLPGVEVFGEGIFLRLGEEGLRRWEDGNRKAIEARIGTMARNRMEAGLSFLPDPSARFVLLHTLSHILVNQLSFECGYSASSLRERIYAAEPGDVSGPMAGILIYASESDSEGSLGGLVRQGLPERLLPMTLSALQRATWCSSDPICREVETQGFRGLNGAACYACALVAETSCTCSNVFLDRLLLVGEDPEVPGFFRTVVDGFGVKGG